MKKIALIFTLSLAATTFVNAQNQLRTDAEIQVRQQNRSVEEVAKIETEKLDKLVKLTQEQREKIMETNIRIEKRRESLLKSNSPEKDQVIGELGIDRNRSYLHFLDEEQKAIYKEKVMSKQDQQTRERSEK